MKKISLNEHFEYSFLEVFQMFITSRAAMGVTDITLRNYNYNMRNIAKYLDVERLFEDVTKRDLEQMVVSMRAAGLAQNTIATYTRMLKTFYRWCGEENLSTISVHAIKEKDKVKETYTDEELEKLLKRPDKECSFAEYRSWVLVNFLMNSGCRAATARAIQNKDVELNTKRVVFRHNKNGKIQVIPLCNIMANILRDYMRVRKGEPEDFLFCNVYGGELTEDAMRHAIAHYNRERGVESTSIHKFRHTFARKYLIDCGGDAFTLQKLLGHSTLEMTRRYCRIFDADIVKDFDLHSPLAKISTPKNRIKK